MSNKASTTIIAVADSKNVTERLDLASKPSSESRGIL